jgi:hypothetical protein
MGAPWERVTACGKTDTIKQPSRLCLGLLCWSEPQGGLEGEAGS